MSSGLPPVSLQRHAGTVRGNARDELPEVTTGPRGRGRNSEGDHDKRHQLVIGVRLIQQAAAVEIDVNSVVPI